jgi:hypothetical protein
VSPADPSGVRVRPGIAVALRRLRRAGSLPTSLTAPPPHLAGLLVGLPGRLLGPCTADVVLAAALGVDEAATTVANSPPREGRTLAPAMPSVPPTRVAAVPSREAPETRPEVWSAHPAARPRLRLAERSDDRVESLEAFTPAGPNVARGRRLQDLAASPTASGPAPAVTRAARTSVHAERPQPAVPAVSTPSDPATVEVGRDAMARVGARQPVGMTADAAQVRVVLSRAAGRRASSPAAAAPADPNDRMPLIAQPSPVRRDRMLGPDVGEVSARQVTRAVLGSSQTDRRPVAVVPAPPVRGLAGLVEAWDDDRPPAAPRGASAGRAPTTPGFDAVDVLTDLLEQILSSEAARHGISVPR